LALVDAGLIDDERLQRHDILPCQEIDPPFKNREGAIHIPAEFQGQPDHQHQDGTGLHSFAPRTHPRCSWE
jgi:hypothetical protein